MNEIYVIYCILIGITVFLFMYPVTAYNGSRYAPISSEHMDPQIKPVQSTENKEKHSTNENQFGTFLNNYPQGKCQVANMSHCECTVGNCPIGSFVSNNEYCSIQCAQISNKKMQDECNSSCMTIVAECNEPDLSKCNDYHTNEGMPMAN